MPWKHYDLTLSLRKHVKKKKIEKQIQGCWLKFVITSTWEEE